MVAVLAGGAATLTAWPSDEAAVAQSVSDPVIFAAGDIACGNDTSGGSCKELETSNLFVNANPDAVLPLGDVQYEKGQLSNFQNHYHGTWGRAKSVTRPAIGNHELNDPAGDGTGYWDYFNGVGATTGPAGERGKGYYSYNIGNWHLIALNSNCSQASCSAGGAQEKWLRADLTAHPNRCTLAYMHHPRWTSDTRDFDKPSLDALMRALYDHRVDVLLVGHSHFYERFAPQDPDQNYDPANGTRHFIVGTGGRNVYGFGAIEPNSEVRNGDTFGVLRMDLRPGSYDWRFIPIAGKTFTDSGSESCHRTTADTSPPTAPSNLDAASFGGNQVKLSWDPSTDEGTGIARYRVFRNNVQVGTSTNLRYTDETVQPNTTYRYHVVAEDGGANLSPASGSVTVTTPGPNLVVTETATEDAHIQAAAPTANTGQAAELEIDRSPLMDGLVKYDVSGIGDKTIIDATMRVYATDSSGNGGAFYKAASNAWTDSTVTWNTAPATTGSVVASIGGVSRGNWYDLDVTDAVTGDGPLSFRVNSSSSDGVDYSSTEGTAGFAPQLRLTLADTTPPDTSITPTSGPSDPTNASSASFAFTADETGARFECRLDGGSWAACTSPSSHTGLSDGSHTFQVRAIDASNNADASPASRTWTVDTVAPAVTLTRPTNGSTANDTAPTLSGAAGSASRDSSTVTARVYSGTTAAGTPVRTLTATASGGAWSVDASPALADGTYTARAEQSDSAGNTGTSGTSTFTVDTTPPTTTITAAPPSQSTSTSASFSFTSSETGSRFECRLDAGSWSSCTSPRSYSSLSQGPHTFDVRAIDAAANSDATPATHTWNVDSLGPTVTLTSPATGSSTTDTTPQLAGSAGSAVGDMPTVTAKVYSGTSASGTLVRTMTATVVAGSWSVDASPALANGTYTVRAEQADAAGTVGLSSASTFSVDTVAPSVPGNVAATAASGARVNVSWTASTDAIGVANYRVFRDGTQIGTPTGTTLADTTVQPNTTYGYHVIAVDRAGNQSAASAIANVTTPAAQQVLTFGASHDTYVRSDQSSSNFGSATALEVDNSPIKHILLRFPVAGIDSRSVVSAKLRLYNTDSASRGGDFRHVASSTWGEGTVTYSSSPSHSSTITASLAGVQPTRWYEVDVTPLVQSDGNVSLKVTSTSSDGANYSSMEGPAGFGPQLIVTVQ